MEIPYYKVAKEALIKWNGLTEGEADKVISEQTISEIEGQVYAKGSLEYAAEGMMRAIGFNKIDKKGEYKSELLDFIYKGTPSRIIDFISQPLHDSRPISKSQFDKDKAEHHKFVNEIIMDTLFSVHDGWVKDNSKKFNTRDKKYQHMPSELIGWKEVKADLLFVKPIFEAAGLEVNEEELEQVYNGRVKDFFLDRGIKTSRNLSDSITQGKEFYPALEGYGEILTTINDPDYVDDKIIPAIEQQGIGNIEEVRKNIVSQIINNPIPVDIERLFDDEKIEVERALEQEITTLTAQKDELQQKNSIVQRIVALAEKRKEIKKEISLEEQRKTDITQGFDD